MLLTKKHLFYALLFLCIGMSVYGHAGHDHDHDHGHEHGDDDTGMDEMEMDEGLLGEDEEYQGDEASAEGEETEEADDDFTGPYKLDKDVIILNAKNFDEVVGMYPLLLVEFYAPWCGHCKSLAPKYAEAATILKSNDPPLYIAKLDAANEKNGVLAKNYGVEGFPTLKLFRNSTEADKTIPYNGARTTEAIVNFMKRKYEPVNQIKTKDSFTKLLNANDVVAMFYLPEKDTVVRDIVHDLAALDENVIYGVTSDKTLFEESDRKILGEKAMILFKDFDDGKNIYEAKEFTKEKLQAFINEHKMPLIVTYTQDKASQIFGGSYDTHVLMFSNESNDYHKLFLESTKKIAKENKDKILHIYISNSETNILKHFKLEDEHLPAVILVHLGKAMQKYSFPIKGEELVASLNKKLYEYELSGFEKKYLAGELKQTLNSEEPTDDSKDAVKYIVGKEFEKRVMESTKDVLLEFYAPWCGHCKALAPKYEELAEKLKSVDSIMIAKMDYTQNEIDHHGVDIQGFPTIYFFASKNKDTPILFKEDKRDVETLLKFIQTHASPFELDGEKYGEGVNSYSEEEEKQEEDKHEEL